MSPLRAGADDNYCSHTGALYEPRPNNFMALAMITLCCCMGIPTLFCAVIAVIYSLQVRPVITFLLAIRILCLNTAKKSNQALTQQNND